MRVTWLADVLRAAGLIVIEQDGWHGRGNEMSGLLGIVGHHTACGPTGDCPSTNILTNGRPDLPGPLAQLQLCRSGHFHTIADGKANHAGTGTWHSIAAAVGNASLLGIEAENVGDGVDVWPRVQMDAYVRGVAAILAYVRLPAERFCTHYEWATPIGRKVDPRGHWEGGGDWWDGQPTVQLASANIFRARVRAVLDQEDDEMGMWTEAEKARLLAGADAAVALEKRWDKSGRTKLDDIWTEVKATDHPELLAGMVKELVDGTKP